MTHGPKNTSLASKFPNIRQRAHCFSLVREFFTKRNVLEIDCPALNQLPALDAYIDPIEASGRYLHTSPEYAMKRLLSAGIGDIYQMGHVFRAGEIGRKHNLEFTLIEWYRLGFTFTQMIQETVDLISCFLGKFSLEILTYKEAFAKHAKATKGRDENEILALDVEPQLGKNCLTALIDYPTAQSALSRIDGDVAKRFEIYHEGVELANGYHELNDPIEQRARFEEANTKRKISLPLDEAFLESLGNLPDCCGVAVGFDRLMMLKCGVSSLQEVLPFTSEEI